ncbi:hypothetical protein T484DRAFT_1635280, partial [Baffinella frigidus]
MPIANVTLGCLAGSGVGSVGHCVPCQAGSYRGGKGSGACDVCPPHSTSNAGSTIAVADCKCVPGYFGADGAVCTECAPGTYQDARGAGSCVPCAAG